MSNREILAKPKKLPNKPNTNMSKLQELIDECKSRELHLSFTYQKATDYSVEIYKGYRKNYQNLFYTDGHIKKKKAINKALKWIRSL